MGAAPLEVVRSFTDSMRSGDIDACRRLVAEELVFSEAECLPFGGDWLGPSGFVDFLGAVGKDYRVRIADMALSEDGDRVLARVSGTISSRATGRSLPLDAMDLYEVRDGLIVRVDVYYKDAAAVANLVEPVDAEVSA